MRQIQLGRSWWSLKFHSYLFISQTPFSLASKSCKCARNHLGSAPVLNVHRKPLQKRNPLQSLFLMSNRSSQRRRKRSETRRKTRKRETSRLLLNRVRRHPLSIQLTRKTQTSMTLMSRKMTSSLRSLLSSLSNASFRLMGLCPIGGNSSPISTRSGLPVLKGKTSNPKHSNPTLSDN